MSWLNIAEIELSVFYIFIIVAENRNKTANRVDWRFMTHGQTKTTIPSNKVERLLVLKFGRQLNIRTTAMENPMNIDDVMRKYRMSIDDVLNVRAIYSG